MTRAELEQEVSNALGGEVYEALKMCRTGLPRMLEMACLKRFTQIQVETPGDVILQDARKLLDDEGYFKFDDTPEVDVNDHISEFDEFQEFIANNRKSWTG